MLPRLSPPMLVFIHKAPHPRDIFRVLLQRHGDRIEDNAVVDVVVFMHQDIVQPRTGRDLPGEFRRLHAAVGQS